MEVISYNTAVQDNKNFLQAFGNTTGLVISIECQQNILH